MRRAAAFPAASSVGVARSPRVGVPSIPRVVSGGWWVCAGVIRTASDACFSDACWGVRPRESWGVRCGWGGAGRPVVVCPSWVWVVAFAVVPFSSARWSPLLPLPGSWVASCQGPQGPGQGHPATDTTKKKSKSAQNTPRQPSQEGRGTAKTKAQYARPHRTQEPETAGGKRSAHETTHVP